MSVNKDIHRLNHILHSIEKIDQIVDSCKYFKKFEHKWLEKDAMIRNFEIIGEATNHLSDEIKNDYPEVEWKKIIGMRNLIAHEYFGVNTKVIWNTAIDILPELKGKILEIKKNL